MARRIATAYYSGNRMHVFDVCAAAIVPALALFIRDERLLRPENLDVISTYCLLSFALSVGAFFYFRVGAGLTRYFSLADAGEIAKASAAAVAATAAVLFVATRLDAIPRSVPVIHFLVLTSVMVGGRLVRRETYRWKTEKAGGKGKAVENLLVIGTNRLAWFYIGFLNNFGQGRHRVVGFVDDQRGAQGRSLQGYPVLGRFESIEKVLDQSALHGVAIDRVVVAMTPTRDQQPMWDKLAEVCRQRATRLEFLPERLGLIDDTAADAVKAPAPVPDWAQLRTGLFWFCKRSFDVLASAVALVVAAPLFLLVAAMVYVEIGTPVLFWQLRLGRDRQPLFVYKFRTLRPLYDKAGQIIPEDRRLPPVGRFLRATRLDELPQLVHILRGEMSIIGPRPLLPVDQPETESIRLAIRPGLTGWAQVHGGKLVSVDDKAALDEWYVRNASFRIDVKILLMTLRTVIFGDEHSSARLGDALATVDEQRPPAEPEPDPAVADPNYAPNWRQSA